MWKIECGVWCCLGLRVYSDVFFLIDHLCRLHLEPTAKLQCEGLQPQHANLCEVYLDMTKMDRHTPDSKRVCCSNCLQQLSSFDWGHCNDLPLPCLSTSKFYESMNFKAPQGFAFPFTAPLGKVETCGQIRAHLADFNPCIWICEPRRWTLENPLLLLHRHGAMQWQNPCSIASRALLRMHDDMPRNFFGDRLERCVVA